MQRIGTLFILIVGLSFALLSQETEIIDFQSLVDLDGSTADTPVGYSFDNFGPYTAFEKIWVFYSNGENAVWRTRRIEEGSEWSDKNIMFSVTDSPQYNIAFDGRYFHMIRSVDGDLVYQRGEAHPDGSIEFDNEVVAYSDPVWQLRTTNGIVPRHFSIAVDSDEKVWVITKVGNGNQPDDDFKPIALASVADDGTWEDRDGFPVDLAPAYGIRGNGRSPNVLEIEPGKILFTWSNDRGSIGPNHGMRARLWENGSLGAIEVTELAPSSARSSLVPAGDGIALLNRENEVSRRNANGTWERVDPGEITSRNWNVLTNNGSEVRLWDFNGVNIRYKETVDAGDTWSGLTTKWELTEDIHQISGTHANGSQGDHHSVLWSTGESPHDIHMGIEGTITLPQAPLLVSPPDGATDIPEEVTLSWESVDLAHTYDVQVSTESDFSTTVTDESGVTETSLDVTGLDLNITHYWRVRAVSEGSTPGEWSDVWHFETVGIPPAPALSSPADGADDQPTSVTFAWEDAPGAETYQLQVATVSDFSATFIDQANIADTEQFVDGFDTDQVYYWRVRAVNEFGEGDWSEVWSFETAIGVPAAPVLTSPANEATDQPVTLTFEWEESDLADTYRLQVAKVSDFSSTVVNTGGITDTSYEVSDLDFSQTYYWRVNASNESGTGGWSSVWSFTTIIEQPEIPVLASPVDGEDGVSTKTEFVWDDADRAATYRLQVATAAEFDSIVVDIDELEATTYSLDEELDEFTSYYWRVNASNVGGTSDWSDVWEFETGQAFPVAPVLESPDDGSTDIETEVLVLWNAVPTATHYTLQVATTADFDSPVIDRDSLTNTFSNVTGLEYDTQYFWRVRAVSPVGAGNWSDVWSFTTKMSPPPVPSLASPEDGAEHIAVDTILVWEENDRTDSYHVQVSTDSDFSDIVAEGSDITDLSFEITGLESLTTYYWRVRAANEAGYSDWSAVWSFTTYDVTSVRELAGGIPDEFNLEQNYPNPFNPTTTIRFDIPEAASVRMEVYNMLGQRIATLIDGEFYTAGTYEAIWDARDDMGREMSSGMYIYRITAGEYVNVKRMLLMK